MPFIIFLALTLSSLPSDILLEKASNLSRGLQLKCLSMLPESSARFAQASLLCGENVTDANFKSALIETSLIHLFVVSGSHLVLLEQMLCLLRLPFLVRIFLWLLYSLVCGWQPPLVRAVVSTLLQMIEKKRGSFWPSDLHTLWSGFLTLLLFPSWLNSRSLLMSWNASLALNSGGLLPKMNSVRRILWISVFIYLLMLPLLWGFGNLHPLSILFNLLLTPLVSFWLLPLALLSVFISPLRPLFISSCDLFLHLMQKFSDPIEISLALARPIFELWALILFLHFVFHLIRLHQRQGEI